MEQVKNIENKEKFGKNVEILIKFIRHGERDSEGNLLDIGRKITKENAILSGINKNDFEAIKAIGSNASPQGELNVGRSLETANIYSKKIAGDEAFNTRVNDILNYEKIKSSLPFNYKEVYDKHLPKNFDDLSDEEKVKVSKKAQCEIVNLLFQMEGDEAEGYRRESAGALAYVVDHYQKMAKRLNSGSKVLIPAGTHGGLMEFLLQQALIIRGKIGFDDINEIGGEFDPSDSYNIDIKTDENGDLQDVIVSFDNPNRPQEKMILNRGKFEELVEYYKNLYDLK